MRGLVEVMVILAVLKPPLAGGDTTLAELANPLRRFDLLAEGAPADAAAVQRAFMAGSWAAFETFAALVVAGKLPAPAPPPADSPHARWAAALLARPAAERDAVLRFLVPARRLHAGLSDALSRPALPACEAPCRAELLAYVAAFDAPRLAVDPKQALGPSPPLRATTPDEAMVGLCGDVGLAAALPHLERFVAAERRFHQLFTDYGTHPQEVDGLQLEALRALVKLALDDRALASRAAAFLTAEIARAAHEKVWFESTSESPRGGSQTVEEVPATGPLARVDTLRAAGRALAGDRAALSGRPPLRPDARWVARLDVSSAVEGRGGTVRLGAGELVALDHYALTAIDLATGDRRFTAQLSGVPGAGGIQAWMNRMTPSARGLVAPAWVRSMTAPVVERSRLVTFDPSSGEVVGAIDYPPGLPPVHHGPDYLVAVPDGVWLQDGALAVKIGPRGELLARLDLAQGERLRAAGDLVARFTDGSVTLERAGKKLWQATAAELTGGAPIDDLVPRAGDLLLYGRYQVIAAVDLAGKVSWRAALDDAWRIAPSVAADGRIVAVTARLVHVLGAGGARLAQAPAPPDAREVALHRDAAYVLVDDAVVRVPLAGGGGPRTVVDKLTRMAHLVGVTDGCVLVSFYEQGSPAVASGTYLGCFPLSGA